MADSVAYLQTVVVVLARDAERVGVVPECARHAGRQRLDFALTSAEDIIFLCDPFIQLSFFSRQ